MQEEKKEINIRILSIELGSIVINDRPAEFVGEIFQLEITTKNTIDVSKGSVIIQLDVTIHPIGVKDTVLGKVNTTLKFGIANIQDIIVIKDGEVGMPLDIVQTLIGVSISTTRGIMFSELRGTYLEKGYIPIVDPRKMDIFQEKVKI